MTAATRPSLIDIGEVARMLAARIGPLCLELLPRGKRVGSEWICGSPAGEPGTQMAVRIRGAKSGVWKHFAGSEAGDALDLVAAVLFAGDKSQALRWARRWLGIDSGDAAALETIRRAVPDPAKLDAEAEHEQEQSRTAAKRLWLAASPDLKDTPVEWYLRGRGIDLAELAIMPRAIRYHPELWHKDSGRRWPAMVATISGPNGYLATHRTWLESTAPGEAHKAPVDPVKMVLGTYRGGHIPLARGQSGKTLREAPAGELVDITEGIEDGLSVAVAIPEARVIAAVSLSNLAALDLPPQITTIRIWRQNDTKMAALAAFERACTAQLRAGRDIIIPEIPADVKDANDLLRTAT